MNETLPFLVSQGFAEVNQMEDFGEHVDYMKYMYRVTPEKRQHTFANGEVYTGHFHQYLWCIYFEGRMVEVVMREYLVKFNSRKPKGYLPEADSFKKGFTAPKTSLGRSLADVQIFLSYS